MKGSNVGLHFGVSMAVFQLNGTASIWGPNRSALMPMNVSGQTIYNRTRIDRELILPVDPSISYIQLL